MLWHLSINFYGTEVMWGVKTKILSVCDKLNTIEELENWRFNSDVCITRELSTSTVSMVWKNNDRLRIDFEKISHS